MGGDNQYSSPYIQPSSGPYIQRSTHYSSPYIQQSSSPYLQPSKMLTNESPSGGINTITAKLDGLRLVENSYGDGDQSKLYGAAADDLHVQWCSGLDYNPEHNEALSAWCKMCYIGDLEGLTAELEPNQGNVLVLEELLDRRESKLRFCALLHVICGARQHPSKQHVECVKVLLKFGASTASRDIAGNTPLHHCMTLYGNSITMEIAQLLIQAGADVNSQNRSGRTPLFEPCVNNNHEYIKLLVNSGAKTNLADNSGLSCQAFTGAAPINKLFTMHKLFSAGYIAQAERERQVGEAECPLCLSKSTLKKCSGCLKVSYCSKDCQRKHWKIHKADCVMDMDGVIDVHPVSNPYNYFFDTVQMLSIVNNGVYPIEGCVELDKTLPRNIVVKIQVPLGDNGATKNGPMYVYNRDRSYRVYITTKDEAYDKIWSVVVEKGYGGIKAYFCACVNETGVLSVNVSSVFNETW